MRIISKTRFNRAIEENSELRLNANQYAATPVPPRSRHSSRIIPTVLVIMIGIATGWLGGRILNGPMNNSPAAAPASDAPALDESAMTPAPETPPHPKHTQGTHAAAPPTPEAEQPPVALEPPVESKPKEVPPKPTKVDKDEGPEKPPTEDPVKEIGREALKKMSKDVKGMRGNSNKNENQSHRE